MHACVQAVGHTAVPILEEVVDLFSWMVSSVPQVPANY